eukprot:CAMPEP_0181030906 /NCGR_PEP_ID=MMETSP1070-20121207/5962_1 /TAXON_ID=265543 /ORGANISM="Minutocellus polymorphus, Strain NH13" /LENGTH=601 /DNA_ID=CAMNT_0023108275 /DNA_START=120 /DNA_END=1922 /DNA_ORIENTATION=+
MPFSAQDRPNRHRLRAAGVYWWVAGCACSTIGSGGRATADAITPHTSGANPWYHRPTGGSSTRAFPRFAFAFGSMDSPSRTGTCINTCGVGGGGGGGQQQQQQRQRRPTYMHNRNGIPIYVMRGGHSIGLPKSVHARAGSREICERGRASPLPAFASQEAGEERDAKENRFQTRKVGISAALFCTYFTVMFAKCSLPAALSLLIGDHSGLQFPNGPSSTLQTAQAAMARVLSLSTIFLSIGKLVLGPVIDTVTGISCLKVALFMLACCLGIISQAATFRQFAVAWICVDFVFSACWAACLNAIHGSFEEEEWPGTIGMLAIAARTGNACAFLTFGALLGFIENTTSHGGATIWMKLPGRDESWRAVFALSAAIQAIPLILLSIFAPQKERPLVVNTIDAAKKDVVDASLGTCSAGEASGRSVHDPLRVLKSVARGAPFWLHLISRSALMIYASFLMFVPSLMSNCFGLSSALAAKTGSLYALGCLLAVSVGSKRYSTLSRRSKIAANVMQLGTATLSALMLLLHVRGMISLAPYLGMFLMFVWGASFAVPFYIPSSMFALEKGGKESSATISDCFDFFGFLCLAGFNGLAASIQQDVMMGW